jgi:predicted nucleic acid-binding protein
LSVVLDGSVALAHVLRDEGDEAIARLFESVADGGALVPGLWHLEVANGLEVAVRRRRLSRADADDILADLAQYAIEVDAETHRHAWSGTRALARDHALTLYDAAYLELAARRGLKLATLDAALARAARRAGVALAL